MPDDQPNYIPPWRSPTEASETPEPEVSQQPTQKIPSQKVAVSASESEKSVQGQSKNSFLSSKLLFSLIVMWVFFVGLFELIYSSGGFPSFTVVNGIIIFAGTINRIIAKIILTLDSIVFILTVIGLVVSLIFFPQACQSSGSGSCDAAVITLFILISIIIAIATHAPPLALSLNENNRKKVRTVSLVLISFTILLFVVVRFLQDVYILPNPRSL